MYEFFSCLHCHRTDPICVTYEQKNRNWVTFNWQCKRGQRNIATLASDSCPSCSEFSPLLESCSDIYTGPTSCLIVTLLFNVFLRYFPLFFFFSDPLLLIGYKCVLGHGLTLWSKVFFKNCLVHL